MDFKKHPDTSFRDIDKLGQQEAAEEIVALREGINYHDYLYYIKNQPEQVESLGVRANLKCEW